jgi:AcrR family transcriptional regulator
VVEVSTAPQAPRVRLSNAARRSQLVELGVELLRTRPLEQLSLEDVATAAGISRALPFHYFPTRRDFLVAVVTASSQGLLEATDTDPAIDPIERVRLGLTGYIEYIEANPDAYVALVRGAAGADEELRTVVEATREAIVERILAGLGIGSDRTMLRLALRGWLGMVEETTVSWLRDGSISRSELVWLLNDALVHIVGATAGRLPGAPGTAPES